MRFKSFTEFFFGKPINMVERRYSWGVAHYGEVLEGKQIRLKKRIRERLDRTSREHEFKGFGFTVKNGVVKVKPRFRYKLRTIGETWQ